MTMTTRDANTETTAADLPTLREAQLALTAAIAHAREEALEPDWADKLLGMRLRLEKIMVARIGQQLDRLERQR
jgi:hypothetical protein